MSIAPEHDACDCRSRLLQAATEVFIDEGYRASIERVAARAGVARQTLYNHFPSKAELFGEVIRQVTDALLISLGGEDIGLRERLINFGFAFRTKALSVDGLGFYRALLSEGPNLQEFAATFYRSGPGQTASRVSAVLAEAMERGELCREDPEFVTNMLMSMLVGAERTQCLMTGEAPPDPDRNHVIRVIDSFLRAFAPSVSPSHPVPQRSIP